MTKNVAIVGATGAVGREILRVLETRNFPIAKLSLYTSVRGAGTEIEFRGERLRCQAIDEKSVSGHDLALFSAGSEPSKMWAPKFAEHGALVVDNSSAFRMHDDVPLCVPEVNLGAAISPSRGIVANPNCSTIQMVVALWPIHKLSPLKRIVVATYQAISGAGAEASRAFQQEALQFGTSSPVAPRFARVPLVGNLLMEWKRDVVLGYQEEELKMVHETRKIMARPTLSISPTTVRVPVLVGHSEAITLECERAITADQVRAALREAPGVIVHDDFAQGLYPTPFDCAGRDEVFVGRIRDDIGNPGGIQMWVVADNLRKGAATNAVQIAEGLLLSR